MSIYLAWGLVGCSIGRLWGVNDGAETGQLSLWWCVIGVLGVAFERRLTGA